MPRDPVLAEDAAGLVRAVATCTECGERFRSRPFPGSRLAELETRHVQDVFPDWEPWERELFFMSGLCGACWDRLMKEPDDEEEA